ncbi:C-C chemokine receptor type 8-like [Danio aesculapii]|uniref:C-C chemokine receptor type 8-like n=1 Tax=Danio aesculapii TaxID=1142201 RepID=UPI0024BF7EFB|nr:C-C chemokine receptor type 8-like [Danio aesculapii]
MNTSTATFSSPEVSTNSTTPLFELIDYLETTVYSINLLFSLPLHCYIIWHIVTQTVNGAASEFFNLNLSVCEIGICMNSFFFILSKWFSSCEALDRFFMGLTFTGRPLFQCLMCVERYLAVVHPVTFLKYKPLRYRAICCAAAWMIALGSCALCLYTLTLNKTHEHAWFSSVELTLIISIQLFCLVAVLKALKQSGPGERKREKEENLMKRRAFHLILITTVNMIVLYFPFAVTSVSIILTGKSTPTVWITGLSCFLLAGFVQPFLYLRRAGKLFICSS